VYGTVENIAIQTECTIQIVECFLFSLHLVVRLYTRVSVFTINLVFFCMTSTLYSDQNTYQPIGKNLEKANLGLIYFVQEQSLYVNFRFFQLFHPNVLQRVLYTILIIFTITDTDCV